MIKENIKLLISSKEELEEILTLLQYVYKLKWQSGDLPLEFKPKGIKVLHINGRLKELTFSRNFDEKVITISKFLEKY